jgi:hypothetical protein
MRTSMTHSRTLRARAAARPRAAAVPLRPRRDGWTPERQVAFLDALAASGCVAEACAAVGLSRQAAYALRVRPEAQQFRMGWDAALDLGIRRLADACFTRAIEGTPVPHYYQGEVVGEHRRYDNRLAMFLLRYRDPLRYAASLDQMVYSGHPEGAGVRFARARNAVADEATALPDGEQLAPHPSYAVEPIDTVAARPPEPADDPAVEAWADHDPVRRLHTERHARRHAEDAAQAARVDAFLAALGSALDRSAPPPGTEAGGDVASTSSTSAAQPPDPGGRGGPAQRGLSPSQATTFSGEDSP